MHPPVQQRSDEHAAPTGRGGCTGTQGPCHPCRWPPSQALPASRAPPILKRNELLLRDTCAFKMHFYIPVLSSSLINITTANMYVAKHSVYRDIQIYRDIWYHTQQYTQTHTSMVCLICTPATGYLLDILLFS